MNRQPDKIFREKLQGYQKPAPADAWQRISQNLRPESNQFSWLKIAAVAMLLAVATFLLFPFKSEVPGTKIAQRTQPAAKTKPATPGVLKKHETVLPQNRDKKNDVSRAEVPRNPSRKNSRAVDPSREEAPLIIDTPQEAIQNVTITGEPPLADAQPAGDEPEKSDGEQAISREQKSTRRMTIVFSAQEVNEKYLEKKEMADATPSDKESSSLRKLLDKAYDLKHNQDPLGELRQKKNEILAFNFKNDRQQHD